MVVKGKVDEALLCFLLDLDLEDLGEGLIESKTLVLFPDVLFPHRERRQVGWLLDSIVLGKRGFPQETVHALVGIEVASGII